jgi:hypothetical protein
LGTAWYQLKIPPILRGKITPFSLIFEAFHIYFKKFFKVYIGIKKSCIFAVQNFEVIQVRKIREK